MLPVPLNAEECWLELADEAPDIGSGQVGGKGQLVAGDGGVFQDVGNLGRKGPIGFGKEADPLEVGSAV